MRAGSFINVDFITQTSFDLHLYKHISFENIQLLVCLYFLQSIQVVLTGLTTPDLLAFKMCLLNSKKNKSLQQMIEGDILDFVDKMLEVFGSKPCYFDKKHIALPEKAARLVALKVAAPSENACVQDKRTPCCAPSTL